MLNERNKIICDITREWDNKLEFISFIYKDGAEIEKGDIRIIQKFLNRIGSKKAILSLHGLGGCSNTGMALSLLFRKKFIRGFWTLVPRQTSSALLYTILISSGVIVSKASIITPLDPYFYHRGRYYPAVAYLESKDINLKKKALKHWEDTSNFCMKILNTHGSICINSDRLNLNNLEKIVRKLLCPKSHFYPVTYIDLKKMNFEHIVCDKNDLLWIKVQKLVNMSLAELSRTNAKFLIDSSSKSI